MNEWQIYICEYLEKSTPITYLFYEKVDQRYNKYLIFSLIDIPGSELFIVYIFNFKLEPNGNSVKRKSKVWFRRRMQNFADEPRHVNLESSFLALKMVSATGARESSSQGNLLRESSIGLELSRLLRISLGVITADEFGISFGIWSTKGDVFSIHASVFLIRKENTVCYRLQRKRNYDGLSKFMMDRWIRMFSY